MRLKWPVASPVWTPRDELRERLNAKLRGQDPGKPYHWRGLG